MGDHKVAKDILERIKGYRSKYPPNQPVIYMTHGHLASEIEIEATVGMVRAYTEDKELSKYNSKIIVCSHTDIHCKPDKTGARPGHTTCCQKIEHHVELCSVKEFLSDPKKYKSEKNVIFMFSSV